MHRTSGFTRHLQVPELSSLATPTTLLRSTHHGMYSRLPLELTNPDYICTKRK